MRRTIDSRLLALLLTTLAMCLPTTAQAKPRTRPLELRPVIGYSWVDLTGFSQDRFVDHVETLPSEELDEFDQDSALRASRVPVTGHGPNVGIGLDVRLWVFSIGGQYVFTHTSHFGLHTVEANVGLRVGGVVAYSLRAGAGYALQSGLPGELSTHGFVGTLANGFDFRITPAMSLGVGLELDALVLTREGALDASADLASGELTEANARVIDGSALGFQLRPQLQFIWHI